VIVACAGSKWNAKAMALVAELDRVDVIVTEKDLTAQELAQLHNLSVEVVNV
jgi:DeoR/GlpR family transcriptional regulator of sugar metabolism